MSAIFPDFWHPLPNIGSFLVLSFGNFDQFLTPPLLPMADVVYGRPQISTQQTFVKKRSQRQTKARKTAFLGRRSEIWQSRPLPCFWPNFEIDNKLFQNSKLLESWECQWKISLMIHWCQFIIPTSLFLDLKWQFSGGREWEREGCHSP